MANPTTNYGFVLPTSTDLVTDLPADFDVALQGVDTRLKALQPGTTLGDLVYSSATANTNTRLGIGSTGQVLTVSGGVPAWSAAAAGGMTLLSTTSLSGTSTTISSISGAYNNLMIIGKDIDTGASNGNVNLRFNADSGSNYRNVGYTGVNTTNTNFMATETYVPGTDMRTGGDAGNFVVNLYRYTDTSKIQGNCAWSMNSTTVVYDGRSDFRYDATAAITSFTVTNSNALSMTGTIYIYGVK